MVAFWNKKPVAKYFSEIIKEYLVKATILTELLVNESSLYKALFSYFRKILTVGFLFPNVIVDLQGVFRYFRYFREFRVKFRDKNRNRGFLF